MRYFSLLIKAIVSTLLLSAAAQAETHLRIGTRQFPPDRGSPASGLFNPPVAVVLQAIYDSLTRLDANGEVQPSLATAWRAEGIHTWVFTLRQGVTFSNGEPFNAKAVVAVVDYLLSPEGRATSVGSSFKQWTIKGAVARDDGTVAITTEDAAPILPQQIFAMRIPAPEAFAKTDHAAFARTPVGTGPFKVKSWSDARVDLVNNTTSWRRAKIDAVSFILMPDQSARLQALVSGGLDIGLETAPEERDTLEALGGQLYVYRKPETEFVAVITVKESPLQDVRVRRALNYAVDKERIIKVFLGGATVPSGQMASPLAFGYNPAAAPYPYDIEKARALMKEAGAGPFVMPTLLVGGANNLNAIYQQIAADLSKIGITMEIRGTTVAKYLEYMYQGGWPVLSFGMVSSAFDALQGYRIRSCGWSHPYFCDPEIMPIITAARSATTAEARKLLTQQAVLHERDNPPGILLWQAPTFDGIGPRVSGYRIDGNDLQFAELTLKP